MAAGASSAADVHTVPQAELRVEQNDNFRLAPGGSSDSVYGYIAELQALIGFATPRGNTSLRPRVRLQEYPDEEDLQRVEGFFDLSSSYEWERSNFDLNAHLSRRDIYNTETPGGDFDPDDPDNPDNPDGGEIVVGETRDKFEFRPEFRHRVTERASIGVGAEYQAARYDADEGVETKTDYDFGVLTGFVTWALSPTSDFTAGAYASSYEAKDDSEETDAIGGLVGYAYRWSELNGVEATLFFEQNDITEFFPVPLEESDSNWGGSFTAYRKLEVSEWRLTFGRSFRPTGDQGKAQFDQIRLQYDRDLSQRLAFRGAARYDTLSGFEGTDGGQDRDYARVDLALKWFMSPTWYVGGGYSYIWQDRETAPSDADNNKFFVEFGYRGLSRQPR